MDKCMGGVSWKLLSSASQRYSYTIVNNYAFKHCCASYKGFQGPESSIAPEPQHDRFWVATLL
jgi:hypothetical protein